MLHWLVSLAPSSGTVTTSADGHCFNLGKLGWVRLLRECSKNAGKYAVISDQEQFNTMICTGKRFYIPSLLL